MIKYEIPGREDIIIENLVLDYNGTIAYDGKLIDGVQELLKKIKEIEKLNIYILTADTYGTVNEECKDINADIIRFPKENAGEEKRKIVEKLGGENTLVVGNGFNDIPMFKEASFSIGIIGGEGMSGKLLNHSDIVVNSILDGLNIILDKNKIKATLRN